MKIKNKQKTEGILKALVAGLAEKQAGTRKNFGSTK